MSIKCDDTEPFNEEKARAQFKKRQIFYQQLANDEISRIVASLLDQTKMNRITFNFDTNEKESVVSVEISRGHGSFVSSEAHSVFSEVNSNPLADTKRIKALISNEIIKQ